MLRTINFHRELKDELGIDKISLDVDNSQDLFLGLHCAFPALRDFMDRYPYIAVCALQVDPTTQKNIRNPFNDNKEIHLVPSIDGAFEAATITIMGTTYTGMTAMVIYIAINIAISMALSAIAQSLASKPDSSNGNAPDTPSFIFNGPVNVTSQGGPVPVAYGTCLVGSTVIAADLKTIDIPIPIPPSTSPGTDVPPRDINGM